MKAAIWMQDIKFEPMKAREFRDKYYNVGLPDSAKSVDDDDGYHIVTHEGTDWWVAKRDFECRCYIPDSL